MKVCVAVTIVGSGTAAGAGMVCILVTVTGHTTVLVPPLKIVSVTVLLEVGGGGRGKHCV